MLESAGEVRSIVHSLVPPPAAGGVVNPGRARRRGRERVVRGGYAAPGGSGGAARNVWLLWTRQPRSDQRLQLLMILAVVGADHRQV